MKPCPNCGSTETDPALPRYRKCQTCGVWFIPDVSDVDLFAYYDSGAYRDRHKQRDEAGHQRRRAAHILQYIEKPSVFVDVGCSMGILLEAVCEQFGSDCYGVDIDTVLTHNVYKHIKYVPRPADCVTMIHSLEHMLRPLDALKEIHSRMIDGGQLVIEVPNGEGYPGAFRFPHVVMFDERSLRWTMNAAGFDVQRVIVHGKGGIERAQPDYYLLMIGCGGGSCQ